MSNSNFNVVFSGPMLSRSGYGVYADWLARGILTYPKFDTLINLQQFGSNTPRQSKTAFDDLVLSRVPQKQINPPHIYISCHCLGTMDTFRQPYDQPRGFILNLNFNAGFETSFANPNIMQCLNKWDHINVMSNFSKQVFINSTPAPIRPIAVTNPGIDTDVFNMDAKPNDRINFELNKVKEKEAYLFVGQLTSNQMFLDRKNMALMIKLFCKTFSGRPDKPALILKTGGTNSSAMDRNNILELIKAVKHQVPNCDVNVYLLHGELTDSEMASLYTHPKIIAHLTATRGEGYGLPLLEASMSATPIIAPAYSGHLDFLGDKCIELAGTLDEIPEQAISDFFPKGSKWYNINEEAFCNTLERFHNGDRHEAITNAQELARINQQKFSLPTTIANLHKYFDKILTNIK